MNGGRVWISPILPLDIIPTLKVLVALHQELYKSVQYEGIERTDMFG